jgi:uncharacterized protein (DUF2235 family)
MKRLVICFDGTWKRAQDTHVSNIEKIARTVLSEADGVQQTVYYVGGVGASYKVDRVLGGSLGLGLSNNLMSAYRFLALNYVPGDHVYVFGFSRGAFTARSLVGMIDRVGLVRSDALIRGALKTAEERYRLRPGEPSRHADTAQEFKRDCCHDHVCIPFLGVFDTVEALGPKARFHNIDFLDNAVAVGRQALAIDERRRIFWPRLWAGPSHLAESGRVRQVWFEGFHSDVGGGVALTGLSDTTLLWMAAEATRQGLAFNHALLSEYLTASSTSAAERHDSMNPGYRLANLLMRNPFARSSKAFRKGWRTMTPPETVGVGISSSALARYREGRYARPNVDSLVASTSPSEPQTESVLAFPESDERRILEVLQQAASTSDARRCALDPCPTVLHPQPDPA